MNVRIISYLSAILILLLMRPARAGILSVEELRVTNMEGPDGIPATADDDPKKQMEVAIAIKSRSDLGLRGELMGAWIDQWTGTQVNDRTIGFGLFDQVPTLPWPHNIIQLQQPPAGGWGDGQWDPGVAIGPSGDIYVVANDRIPGQASLVFLRSQDNTQTWTASRFVTATVGQLADKSLISVDPIRSPDRLYIPWTNVMGGGAGGGQEDVAQLLFLKSTNGGQDILNGTPQSFELIAEQDETEPSGSSKLGGVSAVGNNGKVHVAWLDQRNISESDDGDIRYRRLSADLQVWTPSLGTPSIQVVAGGIDDIENGPTAASLNISRSISLPSIAVDLGQCSTCAQNNVYIAYASENTGGSPELADIFCVRSTDGGDTWESPVRVNSEPGDTVQILPWLVVDVAGRVIVQWLDFRSNANHRVYEVYMAVSYDHGQSFTDETVISTASSDTGLAAFTTPVFIGDYNYMATEPDPVYPYRSIAYPIWGDLRNAPSQPGVTSQTAGDIYYAAVSVDGAVDGHPDFDGDGDVDLSDFSQFSLCFGGANNPPAGNCPPGIDADFDCDGDVDLSDFSMFSLCYTGVPVGAEASLSTQQCTELAGWCVGHMPGELRERFANVVRRGARNHPNTADVPIANQLADAIDPASP